MGEASTLGLIEARPNHRSCSRKRARWWGSPALWSTTTTVQQPSQAGAAGPKMRWRIDTKLARAAGSTP